MPPFRPVVLFLSLSSWVSQKWDSVVIFSSLLYHLSTLNFIKTFFWPHCPYLLTLSFSPSYQSIWVAYISNFISPILSLTYSRFLTLLPITSLKTTVDKVCNGCHIAKSSGQFTDLTLLDLSAAFDTTDLFTCFTG